MKNKNHTHIIQHVCVPELSLPYIHTIVTFLNVIYTHTHTEQRIYLFKHDNYRSNDGLSKYESWWTTVCIH